jgi:predicted ribosomally synthesized peptide with SipW-like signal peptide
MSDNRYGLSRRKVIAGIGTIGVAGAGAALGTSAYFSDEESFENNTLSAGTLDLSVEGTIVGGNDYYKTGDFLGSVRVADGDGDVAAGIEADDVKPGDWVIICLNISVQDNPGYVQITAENFDSAENGYEEPEPDTQSGGDENDPGDPNGAGELESRLLASIWNTHTKAPFQDGEDWSRDGLEELDPTTNNASSDVQGSWVNPNEDGTTSTPDITYTTLEEAFGTYNTGVIVRDENGDAAAINDQTFYLLLELPEEVRNEIQGDSLSFDLVFATEQARNNDNPFDSN